MSNREISKKSKALGEVRLKKCLSLLDGISRISIQIEGVKDTMKEIDLEKLNKVNHQTSIEACDEIMFEQDTILNNAINSLATIDESLNKTSRLLSKEYQAIRNIICD